jgi:chromosome partitioning protein
MSTIITVSNRKGGVAKTTTAVTLAHGLAIKGKRVLVVDIDPQGHVAPCLGLDEEPGMFDLLMGKRTLSYVVRRARENLWIVPGNQRTATAENALVYEQRKVDALQGPLSNGLTGKLDYLIFDTPPGRVGPLQQFAMYLSDLVLIPSSVDHLSSLGIQDIMDELVDARQDHGWNGGILGILPTFHDEVTNESEVNLGLLQSTFGDLLLPAIHRATVLRECTTQGKTVFELDAKSRAAREYAKLVWRVLDAA